MGSVPHLWLRKSRPIDRFDVPPVVLIDQPA